MFVLSMFAMIGLGYYVYSKPQPVSVEAPVPPSNACYRNSDCTLGAGLVCDKANNVCIPGIYSPLGCNVQVGPNLQGNCPLKSYCAADQDCGSNAQCVDSACAANYAHS